MFDIQLLCKDFDGVVKCFVDCGYIFDVVVFFVFEVECCVIQIYIEEFQVCCNSLLKQIGVMKGKGEDMLVVMVEVSGIGDDMKVLEVKFGEIQVCLFDLMLGMLNVVYESVLVGKDEVDNVEVCCWGMLCQFDFEVKDYVDVGMLFGFDFEMGVKFVGVCFMMLCGLIVCLYCVFVQFMIDMYMQQYGYIEMYMLYIVNLEILYGMGQLLKFVDDMFCVEKGGVENMVM